MYHLLLLLKLVIGFLSLTEVSIFLLSFKRKKSTTRVLIRVFHTSSRLTIILQKTIYSSTRSSGGIIEGILPYDEVIFPTNKHTSCIILLPSTMVLILSSIYLFRS